MAPIARADSASDAALAARGDRQAFSRLVERHQRAVYGLAARILGAGDDAREAAQVAFVRAWERRASFDPAREFGAWVLGIARNAAIDRLRHAGRLEALAESADDAQAADDALHDRRTENALDEAVAALPPIYREAVELAYVQGRSVAQIAQILQAPPGTVMARLFRARRLLRARLGDGA
jgi:RNA polymerase sigma-70 factor (ECF subfamily)